MSLLSLALQQKDNLNHFLYIAQIVEARDPYTAGHLWRVAQFSKLLGNSWGVEKEPLFEIVLAAYLHDFGKIVIPDHILNKKSSLTEAEKKIMNTHAEAGYLALAKHTLTKNIAYLVRYHHERWDGNGYPLQLKGEGIPFGSRLISLADSFDAMTSTRPYRDPMSIDQALDNIKKVRGKQFDSSLVEAFLQIDEHRLQHVIAHSDNDKPLMTCKQCGPVIEKPDSDIDKAYCRVCTGEFTVDHDDDGSAEAEFNGNHGDELELLSSPDMSHLKSNFEEFGF